MADTVNYLDNLIEYTESDAYLVHIKNKEITTLINHYEKGGDLSEVSEEAKQLSLPLLKLAKALIDFAEVHRKAYLNSPVSLYINKSNFVVVQQALIETIAYTTPHFWQQPEALQLLGYLVGVKRAPAMQYSLLQIPYRRYVNLAILSNFDKINCAPSNTYIVLGQQAKFLVTVMSNLIPTIKLQDHTYVSLSFIEQWSILEELQGSDKAYRESSHPALWAAEMDRGNEEVYNYIASKMESTHKEEDLDYSMFQALRLSNQEKCWKLAEHVLLKFVKNEFFVRRCTHTLVDSSHGAFKHLLKVILEKKLWKKKRIYSTLTSIFSDTPVKIPETEFLFCIETLLRFWEQPETIAKAMSGTNLLEIFVALVAQAAIDVEKCIPLLELLQQGSDPTKRELVAYFITTLNCPTLEFPMYIKLLESSTELELGVLALIAQVGVYDICLHYIPLEQQRHLFDLLANALAYPNIKKATYKHELFPWAKISFAYHKIYDTLWALLPIEPSYLRMMIGYFNQMKADTRRFFLYKALHTYNANVLLPEHEAEFKELQYELARKSMLDRLIDNAEIGLKFYQTNPMGEKDLEALLKFRKQQPDAVIFSPLTDELLKKYSQ